MDVRQASKQDLEGAFISAYESGDPGRHITCFLALCRHAGIETAAEQRKSGGRAPSDTKAKPAGNGKTTRSKTSSESKKPTTPTRTTTKTEQTAVDDASDEVRVSLSLNVEIPGDWTEEQVRQRIETIRGALRSGDAT